MNYSNFFLASLILIFTGCKNLVENTNEKLKIIEDVDVNMKDEKITPSCALHPSVTLPLPVPSGSAAAFPVRIYLAP